MRAEAGRAGFRPGPRAAWLLLALGLLLLAVAAPAGAQTNVDYDTDDDRLIEITSLNQLNAIRYDVNGDGLRGTVSQSDWDNNYNTSTAFPNASSAQCPGGCEGYELDASLTFPSSGTYSNWTPIGGDGSATRYAAVFDGRGHTLTNLTISSGVEHVGLFGRLAASAVIRDLGLINPTITRTGGGNIVERVGTLAASADVGSTITAVYVSGGTVTNDAPGNYIGGLVSISGGTITASWSTASLRQTDPCNNCNSIRAGGLVGVLTGSIIASYAAGSVTFTGISQENGGLVGRVSGSAARITNSYCDRTVMVVTACVGARTASANAGLTTAAAQTTSELQTPVNYAGLYRAWNLDLSSPGRQHARQPLAVRHCQPVPHDQHPDAAPDRGRRL